MPPSEVSALSVLRRACSLWPYAFIAVSLSGFVYLALITLR
jgi:hypothetical protein